jgi:hypothetical protein
MSRAFHAHIAGAADAERLMCLLSDDDRAEVSSWEKPGTVMVDDVALDYASAAKELPIGLTEYGQYFDPQDPEGPPLAALTQGTLDFAWVRDWHGLRVAFVGDCKRSHYTTPDGTDSLQVHAYAFGYADLVQADAYVIGLWSLSECEWRWMTEPPIELASRRAAEIWGQIREAARNTEGEAVTGQHCRECWGRTHCSEHLLPAAFAETALAPLAQGGGITNENAHQLLLLVQGLEDLVKPAKDALKAFVSQGGRIQDPVTRKVWGEIQCKGKESVKKEAVAQLLEDLRAHLGDGHHLVRKYGQIISRGKPYTRFDWVKP